MQTLIGRNQELIALNKIQQTGKSEFVAVYGRRRIGKTFLIREAFKNKFDFYLTGTANTGIHQQLNNFHRALSKYDKSATVAQVPDNWFAAFHQLEELLEKSKNKKKVIFLDELPWLDTPKSGFISALEYFWNSYAGARKNIILIVCGSAASWMINKLIHNKGGLHNRVTLRIRLEQFTLNECETFFKNKSGVFNRYQLVQLYMVMGGVPFYLDQVDVGLSAAQNIDKLCFQPNGFLVGEFYDLYNSLFNKAGKHLAIVEALSKKSKGLTRDEIIEDAKLPNAGSTTRILKELEESGFLRKYPPYGKKERTALYQLADFYSLFYLKFIRNSHVLNENMWITGLDTPRQRAWSGYAFEQVCLAHLVQIKQALGISGMQTMSSSWTNTGGGPKKQIDLVIDRRDGVINICEMKFSIKSFSIDKKYYEELQEKLDVFREATRTSKSLYLTMVTTFGLRRNVYSNSLVQQDLNMDDLF